MMAKLTKEELERGVVCSSAGNHAQGVAMSAKRLKCDALVSMPLTTSDIKFKSVSNFGATVELIGDSFDEAQTYAKELSVNLGKTFIPAFDHPDAISGQGTTGMEIMRQMQAEDPLHAIFVPVGAGGMIAGIVAYVKRVNPKDVFEEKRSILEPAGALALAGAEAYSKFYGLKGENMVVITSGPNMNFDKLRMVTELANVGRKQEAVLATVLPEIPGSFKKYCGLVGSDMNITEFKYRCTSHKDAVVLYSAGLHTEFELNEMHQRMESATFKTYNLIQRDLVKDHLRYLIGARLNVADEILCRFIFPERPGALMKFLDVFSPRWNISLFHYRGEGDCGANVLTGIQVPRREMKEFQWRANNLGYAYEVVTDDEAYQLLMI